MQTNRIIFVGRLFPKITEGWLLTEVRSQPSRNAWVRIPGTTNIQYSKHASQVISIIFYDTISRIIFTHNGKSSKATPDLRQTSLLVVSEYAAPTSQIYNITNTLRK